MAEPHDDDIESIKESYDLDDEEASEVRDLVDELGVDDDDAFEIWQSL